MSNPCKEIDAINDFLKAYNYTVCEEARQLIMRPYPNTIIVSEYINWYELNIKYGDSTAKILIDL